MAAPEVVEDATYVARTASRAELTGGLAALFSAILGSTLHRIRRGEGALLAVNLSLIAHQTTDVSRALAQALVSALAIGTMYAFNDLYDAPADWRNPKKDRTLIAVYVEQWHAGVVAIVGMTLLTLALSFATLEPTATAAVAAVMTVNLVYSIALKGVPVLDVAWCGLWGALYAGIATASTPLLVLVGLMTAICHLFQALTDRGPDAANGIRTTAVRSPVLARNVLTVLSLLLFVVLRGPLGPTAALTALTPLVLFLVVDQPGMVWMLTKVYFGVMWLYVLGFSGAVG